VHLHLHIFLSSPLSSSLSLSLSLSLFLYRRRPSLEYERCPIGTYNTWWWAATRATGDFMMTCTARRAAREWAQHGHSAFNYYFSHTPEFSVNTYPTAPWGAFHGSEVPFVWGAEFEITGSGEKELSDAMVKYWANFARSGDPNKGGGGGTPFPHGTACRSDADCPTTSYCMNDASKTPPFTCHGTAAAAAVEEGGRSLPKWPRINESPTSDGVIRLATGIWAPYSRAFNKANVSAVHGLRKSECDFWDKVNTFVVDPTPPHTAARDGTANASRPSRRSSPPAQLLPEWGGDVVAQASAGLAVPTPPTPAGAVGQWRVLGKSAMTSPRALFGTASVGTNVFCIGGLAPAKGDSAARVHQDTDLVDVLNTASGEWHAAPSLQFPRSALGTAAVMDPTDATQSSGRVFAIGGMYGDPTDTTANFYAVPYVEMLDVGVGGVPAKSWTRLADLPANRTEVAVVVVGARIYVIGGAGATAAAGDAAQSMWSYDTSTAPEAGEWRVEPSLPTLRTSVAAGVLGGKILVAGGMRGFLASSLDPDPLRTVDMFDPATRKWNEADATGAGESGSMDLPSSRHSAGAVVAPPGTIDAKKNALVIAGGYANGELGSVLALVDQGGKKGGAPRWALLPPMKVQRMAHGMAATGKCVYAIGGMASGLAHRASKEATSPVTAVVEALCRDDAGVHSEL
jgi:hypothetical protein